MSKKLITHTGPRFKDENLTPRFWRNDDAQVHVFKSFLKRIYPFMPDFAPKIFAKPGRVTEIPHQYYTIYTRDDSPAKGTWFISRAVEDAAPTSLHKGDAYGHQE